MTVSTHRYRAIEKARLAGAYRSRDDEHEQAEEQQGNRLLLNHEPTFHLDSQAFYQASKIVCKWYVRSATS